MTAALEGGEHAPATLYPRERPGTHFTGGWIAPGAGLDGRKISSPPGFDPGQYNSKRNIIYIYIHLEHDKKTFSIWNLELLPLSCQQ